jgi:adenine deaminase
MANLLVLDDLAELKIDVVFYRGRLVARQGEPLFPFSRPRPRGLAEAVNIKPFGIEDLRLDITAETASVIEVVPGQIITRKRLERLRTGIFVPDTGRDILKAVVVERHRATGNIGRGLVMGFGLKRGALASSIAHDSHNIVAVGTNDEDIYVAVKEIEARNGGLVAVAGGRVLASLALPIAGLLSDRPLREVAGRLGALERAAVELGSGLASPFSTLSFLALPVIPELRLTDRGLVDVNEFKLLKME